MTPSFSSPPNPALFKAQVWSIVKQIPAGKVATYGQIAGLIPVPPAMTPKDYMAFAPRWVGGAMAACPEDVPWQRVINAKGEISLRPGGGGDRQKELLEQEGITFDEKDRIDLKLYRWNGPGLIDQE